MCRRFPVSGSVFASWLSFRAFKEGDCHCLSMKKSPLALWFNRFWPRKETHGISSHFNHFNTPALLWARKHHYKLFPLRKKFFEVVERTTKNVLKLVMPFYGEAAEAFTLHSVFSRNRYPVCWVMGGDERKVFCASMIQETKKRKKQTKHIDPKLSLEEKKGFENMLS